MPRIHLSTTASPAEAGTVAAMRSRAILCDVTGETVEAAVFDRAALRPGARVAGPALIAEPQTTTLVSRDFRAEVDGDGNLLLTRIGVGEARP